MKINKNKGLLHKGEDTIAMGGRGTTIELQASEKPGGKNLFYRKGVNKVLLERTRHEGSRIIKEVLPPKSAVI